MKPAQQVRGRLLFALMAAGFAAPLQSADPAAPHHLQFGVSTSVVRGVNINDARAAMRDWAQFMSERSSGAMLYTTLLSGFDDLVPLFRQQQVQALALTTAEYVRIASLADTHLIVSLTWTNEGERYVILVRADSGIHALSDLKGHRLVVHNHSNTSLAEAWLEVLLDSAGLGRPETFFGRLTTDEKLSKGVVLPVFFRQEDACLVTRRGWDAMAELNPQIGLQLRAVATSPPLLPSLFVFHKDYPPQLRQVAQEMLVNVGKTRIGNQMGLLFKVPGFAVVDASVLQDSLALLAKAERVRERLSKTTVILTRGGP